MFPCINAVNSVLCGMLVEHYNRDNGFADDAFALMFRPVGFKLKSLQSRLFGRIKHLTQITHIFCIHNCTQPHTYLDIGRLFPSVTHAYIVNNRGDKIRSLSYLIQDKV